MMTQTAEYALRALSELATLGSDESLRASDLAGRTGVPEAYLAKVLRRLVEHGVLQAQRGHGGGFALTRPPERVRFVEILRALDSMPSTQHCAFGWGKCNNANPCPLHTAWARLNEALTEWATTTTLADVARKETHRRSR
jgi:Rrf2 family protein